MKKGILIQLVAGTVCLGISIGSMACPELQGRYTCNYKGFGVSTTVQEQRQKNKASYFIDYSLGKVNIIVDGEEHTIDRLPPLDRHARNFKYKAFCKGDRVDFSGTGDMVNGSGKANLEGSLIRQGRSALINVVVHTPAKTRTVNLVCNP